MGKRRRLRRFIGDFLIFITVLYTVYLSVIMVGRIQSVVLRDSYIKLFICELAMCLVFLILACDIRFRFLTKAKGRALKVLGWFFRIIVIALAGFMLVTGARSVIGGFITTPGTADNAIVLGLALRNGQPTEDLIFRVDTAVKFSTENPNATLILTGGNPNEDGKTEAEVMKELLIGRGVPEDRMVLEDRAEITIDNFKNTAEIVDPSEPIVLISSDYHMDRAVRTAEDAGFTDIIRRPAPSSAIEYPANIIWEVLQEIIRLLKMI